MGDDREQTENNVQPDPKKRTEAEEQVRQSLTKRNRRKTKMQKPGNPGLFALFRNTGEELIRNTEKPERAIAIHFIKR